MNIIEKRKQAIKCLYASMALISLSIATFKLELVMILCAVTGVMFFLIYLHLSFKYWKCPACGEQFPVIYSRMDQRVECWYCLEPLIKD
ncbi:hypothetical protein [Proteocatella sphenisci]|uniref:hypothetical protein n=1 Tax=Proteocatella sphenisci TaxID=181070 RepID=UPI0004907D87|nr:hypothetical protein [Proteocatella sphenisci]